MPTASLIFRTPTGDPRSVNRISAQKRVSLTQLGGSKLKLSFPYGPSTVDYQNMGLAYQEVSRPQRKPLLVGQGGNLRTITFNTVIADKRSGGRVPIQKFLDDLEIVSTEDVDCGFTYGLVALPYRVRITRYSYTAVQRDSSGNILKAALSLQLTERPEINQDVTALAAISFTPVASPAAPSGGRGGGSATTTPSARGFIAGCELTDRSPECDAARELRRVGTLTGAEQVRYWNDALT